MTRTHSMLTVLALGLGATTFASPAHAANILFVADGDADTGVVDALTADGHTVTSRTADMTEAGSNTSFVDPGALAEYDAIFWSIAGGAGYTHDDPVVFTNLTQFVSDGGRVMIFGYDGTIGDTMLVQFMGGTGSRDQVGTPPGPIATIDTSVTVGMVDLRGMIPSDGYSDRDCIDGLGADTTLLVQSGTDAGCAQWSLRTVGDGEVAWVSNGSYSGSDPSWTRTTSPFNGAVRNFASAADASSGEPGAPQIEFDRVYGGEEGAAITVTVAVSDLEGDAVTYSWDLDGDGTFGENAGMPTHTIAAGTTDGESSVRLSVRASDGTHTSTRTRTVRIRNVAPTIVSDPPVLTRVGATVRYTIVTEDPAGARDPMTYTIVRAPAGAEITELGVFVWRPTDADVTMPGERLRIEIAADDGDGGSASQTWEMIIAPNQAPGPVAMLYPANDIGILDTTPRLVVSNAYDSDLDSLTYYFEVDDEETFAEPRVLAAEMVEQGTGYTAFELTEALPAGVRYHWRAWSFDGAAASEPMTTTFVVLQDPDADAGPMSLVPDAGLPVDGGGMRMETPGGCSVGRAGSGAGAQLVLLGIALAATLRRRRRG